MNIDIKDTISLNDNNEYLVISKANYNNAIYYYLIDENNHENIKFCVEKSENNSLLEIEDANLIKTLLPLFIENGKKIISDEA